MVDVQLYHDDCLDVLPQIETASVDAIIADLPYGTTACKWDTVIPFEPLWTQYKRVIKKRGAIVLFGSQPFTSALVMSNPKWFKYCWVWNKRMVTNVGAVKFQPLRCHEDIAIFYKNGTQYNPQKTGQAQKPFGKHSSTNAPTIGNLDTNRKVGVGYPKTILDFARPNNLTGGGLHPTQKPVALLEYLVKTYTNEGETVLDNVMGSGTTGVACINTGRSFVGVELDVEYFEIAQRRIEEAQARLVQMRMVSG